MKCPNCNGKNQIEADIHSDGFAQDLFECGDCGCIWVISNKGIEIVKKCQNQPTRKFPDFVCPTCKQMVSYEVDLNAYQFHEELYECSICGTICSSTHNHVEVVNDSQAGSFLSAITETVEADDYAFI